MTKERSLLIYIVDILTRKCELVRLPLEDNEFIYWPLVRVFSDVFVAFRYFDICH